MTKIRLGAKKPKLKIKKYKKKKPENNVKRMNRLKNGKSMIAGKKKKSSKC